MPRFALAVASVVTVLAVAVAVAVAGCGGGSEADAVSTTVRDYLSAVNEGDGKVACSKLVSVLRSRVRDHKRSCEAAVVAAAHQRGEEAIATGRAKLGQIDLRAQVNGDRATVFASTPGVSGEGKVILRRVAGTRLIVNFA